MSTETKNKIVPRLRFPEFRNAGEWSETSLNKLGELISGLTYSPDDVRDNGLLVLRSSNIQNGKLVFDDNVFVRPDIKGANLSEPNDILICVRNGSKPLIGKNAIIPEGMPLCTHGAFMTVFRSPISKFVFQLFQTDEYYTQVTADLGATINSINGSNFLKYKFIVPTNPKEQQKIADCLSSLDELITAQSQKLEALQAHKKGLMQQLFPADGETIPKLRFKEFNDCGEWVEKTLSQVANYENGKAHEQDIAEDGKYIVVNSKFISSDSEVKKYTNTAFCLATKGDILMVLSDVPNGKAIAKCFFVDTDNLYSVNQRICKITAFDANSLMLFYILNRNQYFLAFDDGVKQTNLRNEDVLNFPFLLPENQEEQQKIVDCVSSLDERIKAQVEEIDVLKEHKKGLMQGLFSNVIDYNS